MKPTTHLYEMFTTALTLWLYLFLAIFLIGWAYVIHQHIKQKIRLELYRVKNPYPKTNWVFIPIYIKYINTIQTRSFIFTLFNIMLKISKDKFKGKPKNPTIGQTYYDEHNQKHVWSGYQWLKVTPVQGYDLSKYRKQEKTTQIYIGLECNLSRTNIENSTIIVMEVKEGITKVLESHTQGYDTRLSYEQNKDLWDRLIKRTQGHYPDAITMEGKYFS